MLASSASQFSCLSNLIPVKVKCSPYSFSRRHKIEAEMAAPAVGVCGVTVQMVLVRLGGVKWGVIHDL